MKKAFLIALFSLFLSQTACTKSGEAGLQKILSSSKPPVGVVFEIGSGDEEGLKWAIPVVQSYAKRLRLKFSKIKLAVVSHGEEQFQLTKSSRDEFADTHKQVASLIKNQGVEFHVCGNYAASSGIDEDEFVDFINVASRGSAQIRAYKNDGYQVLFIQKPKPAKTQ